MKRSGGSVTWLSASITQSTIGFPMARSSCPSSCGRSGRYPLRDPRRSGRSCRARRRGRFAASVRPARRSPGPGRRRDSGMRRTTVIARPETRGADDDAAPTPSNHPVGDRQHRPLCDPRDRRGSEHGARRRLGPRRVQRRRRRGHPRRHRAPRRQGDPRQAGAPRPRRGLRPLRAAARRRRRDVRDPRLGQESRDPDRLLLRQGSRAGRSPRRRLPQGKRLVPRQRHPSRLRRRSAPARAVRAMSPDRQGHGLRGLRPLAGQRIARDGDAAARLRDVGGGRGQDAPGPDGRHEQDLLRVDGHARGGSRIHPRELRPSPRVRRREARRPGPCRRDQEGPRRGPALRVHGPREGQARDPVQHLLEDVEGDRAQLALRRADRVHGRDRGRSVGPLLAHPDRFQDDGARAGLDRDELRQRDRPVCAAEPGIRTSLDLPIPRAEGRFKLPA